MSPALGIAQGDTKDENLSKILRPQRLKFVPSGQIAIFMDTQLFVLFFGWPPDQNADIWTWKLAQSHHHIVFIIFICPCESLSCTLKNFPERASGRAVSLRVYSWPLNNTGLKCMGPLTREFVTGAGNASSLWFLVTFFSSSLLHCRV